MYKSYVSYYNMGTWRYQCGHQLRINYHKGSASSYSPVFDDFNGDGRIDIFMNDASFSSTHDSTTILLQSDTGTFVDTGRQTCLPK